MVWVQTLARDIALCSSVRHLTLTVPLSTQVFKWVPANLKLVGNTVMDWHPIQWGVEIVLVASFYRNQERHLDKAVFFLFATVLLAGEPPCFALCFLKALCLGCFRFAVLSILESSSEG